VRLSCEQYPTRYLCTWPTRTAQRYWLRPARRAIPQRTIVCSSRKQRDLSSPVRRPISASPSTSWGEANARMILTA
jgi:hypothetical protein